MLLLMKYLTLRLLLSIELWELWIEALGGAAREWRLGEWCLVPRSRCGRPGVPAAPAPLHSASPFAAGPFVLGSQNGGEENKAWKTN